jgi:hypothetical protein
MSASTKVEGTAGVNPIEGTREIGCFPEHCGVGDEVRHSGVKPTIIRFTREWSGVGDANEAMRRTK